MKMPRPGEIIYDGWIICGVEVSHDRYGTSMIIKAREATRMERGWWHRFLTWRGKLI
jgi:hypothetical protein